MTSIPRSEIWPICCHFRFSITAAAARMAALKVKLRMHPRDRAEYRDAALTLNGDYLNVTYLTSEGSHAENSVVLLLPPERAVSAVVKRGVRYVVVESSTKNLKIKVPSAEAQDHWASALSVQHQNTQPEEEGEGTTQLPFAPPAATAPTLSKSSPSVARFTRQQSRDTIEDGEVITAEADDVYASDFRRSSVVSRSSGRDFQPPPRPRTRRLNVPAINIIAEDDSTEQQQQPRLSATSQASEQTPNVSPRVSASGPSIALETHLESSP